MIVKVTDLELKITAVEKSINNELQPDAITDEEIASYVKVKNALGLLKCEVCMVQDGDTAICLVCGIDVSDEHDSENPFNKLGK